MKSSFPVSEAGDWLQAAAGMSPLFPATVLLTSSGSRGPEQTAVRGWDGLCQLTESGLNRVRALSKQT